MAEQPSYVAVTAKMAAASLEELEEGGKEETAAAAAAAAEGSPVATTGVQQDEPGGGESAPAANTAADTAPAGASPTAAHPQQEPRTARRKDKSRSKQGRRGEESAGGAEQYSTRNLYIRGLRRETTSETLHALFVVYGDIVSAKAIMSRDVPAVCKGFGFVMMKTQAAAVAAATELFMLGHSVQFAKVSSRVTSGLPKVAEDPTNLYFSNLPLDYTESKLEALLRPHGNVVSCRILRDFATQASRGVGFARMLDRNVCETIVKALSGAKLEQNAEPLQCKFAHGPSQKKARQWPYGGGFPHSHAQYDPMDPMQAAGMVSPLYIPPGKGMMPPYGAGMYYGGGMGLPMGASGAGPETLLDGAMSPVTMLHPFQQQPMQFIPQNSGMFEGSPQSPVYGGGSGMMQIPTNRFALPGTPSSSSDGSSVPDAAVIGSLPSTAPAPARYP